MQIDYFLNTKFVNKINDDLITTTLFETIKQKVNFNPMLAIKEDRYLTNYMKAYGIKITDPTHEEIFIKNIVSLLYVENEVGDLKFEEVCNLIKSIDNGCKPKTKLEKLIFNIIEINRLISKVDFEINDDNYELIVHLLFRNTELNLDRKINYFRNETNKIGLKLDIAPENIEKEVINIFKFMLKKPEESFDGVSKVIIIFYAWFIIQPHQKFNVILSFLITSWYLRQNNFGILRNLDLFTMINHWTDLINLINESIGQNLNFDKVLSETKDIIRKGFKRNYLNKLLHYWIDEHNLSNKINLSEKLVILSILENGEEIVDKESISTFHLANKQTLVSLPEINKNIQKLISLKIIKTNKDKSIFTFQVEELAKLKEILK